jgi:Sec-independent protein secretion pathway component TatC
MFLVMIPLVALYFIAAAITFLNDKRRDRALANLAGDSIGESSSISGTNE